MMKLRIKSASGIAVLRPLSQSSGMPSCSVSAGAPSNVRPLLLLRRLDLGPARLGGSAALDTRQARLSLSNMRTGVSRLLIPTAFL